MRTCGTCKRELPATTEYFYPRAANPRSRQSAGLLWRCRECSRIYARNWWKNHPKTYHRNKAAQRLRYWAHPEVGRIRVAEYRARNPGKARLYFLRTYTLRKEQHLAWARNKRARKRGAAGKCTSEDVRRIMEMQANKCAYCGSALGQSFHRDHKIPLCRGGSNWPENIALTCASCNHRKSRLTASEFLSKLKVQLKRA